MGESSSLPDWKVLYAAAMLESDRTQQGHRLDVAEAAMHKRLKEVREMSSAEQEKVELQYSFEYLNRVKELS